MPDKVALPADTLVSITCPQCHAPVGEGDTSCPECGINLAWAAALAERRVLISVPEAEGAPYIADIILPRFGEFLVRHDYIAETQLQTALNRQRELAILGVPQTIGQILLEMGVVTREQLDQASMEQVKQLQDKLQEANRRLEQRVTERTQELQEALSRLAELSEVKSNFAANISHEMHAPLVSVKGYGTLLAAGRLGALTDEQREAVDIIVRSAAQLEEVVNHMTQFASSARGKLLIRRSMLVFSDVLKRVEDVFAPRAAEAKVQLRFECASQLPLIWADAEKIRWVLYQLLDNAIKFTPANGMVTLAVELRDEQVQVSVRDTGVGIPPDSLEDIFEPLHTTPETVPARPYEGVGLSLALVKRIIEAHHSKISVESRPGQGTVFAFSLPVVNFR